MTKTASPEKYIESILGQQTPLELELDSEDPFHLLLGVDSFWNLGKVDEANKVLTGIRLETNDTVSVSFACGLQALLDSNLGKAYHAFLDASKATTGMKSIFFGERAINVREPCERNFNNRLLTTPLH